MGKNIYVGNLAYTATEESINNLFSRHGTVSSCRLVTDRDTGRSKGFCFVEMSTNEEAERAISSLDGKDMEGRALKVNEARPRAEGRSNSRSTFSLGNDRGGYSASRNDRRNSSY